jgi:glycosyltransferase involved in cell wall biosynthesis
MQVLLLANQPERTTRLRMFEKTLKGLGYDIIVPCFSTRNWIKIAGLAKKAAKDNKPDVVHIFNVPDIIYHNFARLKGVYFKKLIYDYRSPWGLELQQTFGNPGRMIGEHFEQDLARSADTITTVNTPLKSKVAKYALDKDIHIIPNYPLRSFSNQLDSHSQDFKTGNEPIIFIGRIATQEGIQKLLELAKAIPEKEFWIVGGGPFSWWYLWRRPRNIKALGWQPHENVADLVKKAKICLIPRRESVITPYSTEKSVWKLNEYLNLGKLVIASGISQEQSRKNLIIVNSRFLKDAIIEHLEDIPKILTEEDYRYWDGNAEIIRSIYENLS